MGTIINCFVFDLKKNNIIEDCRLNINISVIWLTFKARVGLSRE